MPTASLPSPPSAAGVLFPSQYLFSLSWQPELLELPLQPGATALLACRHRSNRAPHILKLGASRPPWAKSSHHHSPLWKERKRHLSKNLGYDVCRQAVHLTEHDCGYTVLKGELEAPGAAINLQKAQLEFHSNYLIPLPIIPENILAVLRGLGRRRERIDCILINNG